MCEYIEVVLYVWIYDFYMCHMYDTLTHMCDTTHVRHTWTTGYKWLTHSNECVTYEANDSRMFVCLTWVLSVRHTWTTGYKWLTHIWSEWMRDIWSEWMRDIWRESRIWRNRRLGFNADAHDQEEVVLHVWISNGIFVEWRAWSACIVSWFIQWNVCKKCDFSLLCIL